MTEKSAENDRFTVISDEQALQEAKGLVVADVWRAMIVVERLAKTGDISIHEYSDVHQFYERLKQCIQETLGKSVEELVSDFRRRVAEKSKEMKMDSTEVEENA